MSNNTIKTSSLLETGCPHRRYLGRCVKNGLTRNLDWWTKMFLKGKVENNGVPPEYILGDDINLFINTMNGIMASLEFNFPGNWEVHLEYEIGDDWDEEEERDVRRIIAIKPLFLIRFPEVNITNSQNGSHLIKELFYVFRLYHTESSDIVQNYYRIKSYWPGTPMGTRGQLTAVEHHCQYLHSHLSSTYVNSYNETYKLKEFCTGSNELNDLQAILREGFDASVFNLYLLTVESFVKWESIEGRPYMYISNITESNSSEIPLEWNPEIMENYKAAIKEAMNNYYRIEANFNFMVDRFIIKVDEKFIQFVKNLLITSRKKNLLSTFLVQRHENHYRGYGQMTIYTQKELNSMLSHSEGFLPYTYIRGEQITFKIIAHRGKAVDPNDFTVHPSLLNHVKKQFENELYKKQVQRSAIESSIKGNYAKKCIA